MQKARLEIALESGVLHYNGFSQCVDEWVCCRLLYEIGEKLLGIEAVNGRIDVPQVASQFCFFFHEKDFEVLFRKLQGRCHAGKPAAEHKGFLVHVHGDLFSFDEYSILSSDRRAQWEISDIRINGLRTRTTDTDTVISCPI